MGGNTGNIRSRNPSGTNGYKTLGSILASDSGSGAGSVRRMYSWNKHNNPNVNPFTPIFGITNGQFRSRSQWFISSIIR